MAATDVAVIFTDGACSGNPGPGGWAAILLTPDGQVRELGGADPRTTNNRMELTAAIEALRALARSPGPLVVRTDSEYLIGGITRWVRGWKRRGWRKADGSPVLNRDLWETLDAIVTQRPPGSATSWQYIPGHAGRAGNVRADALAVSYAKGRPLPLYRGGFAEYPHLRRNARGGGAALSDAALL